MNSKKLPVDKRTTYENEFSEFLLKRIGNAGGSIQLQHITGHMSQVRNEVRNTVGTSVADLKQFLREHPNLFCLDNNIVSLANPSMFATSGYDSDDSSKEPQTALPSFINHGKGVIIKLLPSFGFIKSKDPIKTEVYFNAKHCGDANFDLTSFLYVGANVYFDAVKKNGNSGCKYTATEVKKADNSNPEDNAIRLKSRKSRDTGLYDPLTLDGEGIIQKVFPNLGFIAVNGDDSNTVFFYKSRIVNYNNIVDLTKIISKGDVVEFNAHRSTKSDAKARWEATKVWKKSSKVKQNTSTPDGSQCSSNNTPLPKQSVSATNSKGKEMKKNHPGKICPRSNGAVIKFGANELADGDSAMYFICGTQVTEIAWEFSEGDEVKFDAVKIKSAPGWKAVLVWVGEKPNIVLPTCLGDFSEFTDEENEEISSSVYTSKSSSNLSINSSSSFKSVSVKSDSISSKRDFPDFKEEEPSKFSDSPVNEKVKDKKPKIHPSQNNLPSYSKNSLNLKNEDENCSSNKFVSSWGDSPYPEDDSENIDFPNASSPVESIHSNLVKTPDKENVSRYASSVEENSSEEMNNDELANSNLKSDIDDSKNAKETPCIKKFKDVAGQINKVYSKFAEVKSCNLQKSVSFFWNDFYTDGMSVEELELEDLKQVLKVGDLIHFNYFIVIDDSGQTWQRVSLAWKGHRPKRPIEISPEDFIKQNSLSVTINNDFSEDEIQDDPITSRKFLTLSSSVDPDEEDEYSKTESLPDSKVKRSETVFLGDFKSLSSTVCEILKKDVFSRESKVDLYSISEEIVNIVLENCNGIKSGSNSSTASQVENSVQKIPNICVNCKEKSSSNFSCQVTKDCDVQTIITGEIIAQNIFTEC